MQAPTEGGKQTWTGQEVHDGGTWRGIEKKVSLGSSKYVGGKAYFESMQGRRRRNGAKLPSAVAQLASAGAPLGGTLGGEETSRRQRAKQTSEEHCRRIATNRGSFDLC